MGMKDKILILEEKSIGRGFVPEEYLPEGKTEYYIRDKQQKHNADFWRPLKAVEVEELVRNGNTADDWDLILVHESFEPSLVRNCSFFGLVRIGKMQIATLKHHDLKVPIGITNSQIIACDIGDMVAIHNVHYLSHYIIGNTSILVNIDEMNLTNHSKFGNAIMKDGEKESVLTWMDIMNESGTRKILPFDGMLTADAYMWGKYRNDHDLMLKLHELTLKRVDTARGYYGKIGEQSVIKNTRIIKNVNVGAMCYIKGANKLKNLTINSSDEAPTQIGEGVEMVNGIVGYGCRVFYGCKAVRFIMGNNSNLKYGARLINSFLGSNSTISCCEVLNNLIFPSHEQHHNNSFLVAAVVKGQSNIAAGATLGSNHNSRANDNEIEAGRGFWPGLCTSIKHSSTFASFTLMAKGSYPAELHIPIPFSLVNNNESKNRLEMMPAFWWLYNMYALARNEWKYLNRDKRVHKMQNIEYDTLAPDTVEEIVSALPLLEKLLGVKASDHLDYLFIPRPVGQTEIRFSDVPVEKSKREICLLKPAQALQAYLQMLFYYSMRQVDIFIKKANTNELYRATKTLPVRDNDWVNLGGQIMTRDEMNLIFKDIKNDKLSSWDDVHRRYDDLFENYPQQKFLHALSILRDIFGISIDNDLKLKVQLSGYLKIHDLITERVFTSRKKDYDNHFKKLNFESQEEMDAVLGKIEDNGFIKAKKLENEKLHKSIKKLISIL